LKHSWTQEEQESFIEWFKDYLKNNKNARKEILSRDTVDDNRLDKAVRWFVLDYGWKIKGE
jgi:hypothetical protein